jgi:hypothetical protein
MELSAAQKAEIVEHGYTKISGVVPRVAVNAALRAINHSLGEGVSREEINKFRSQSYCPEVQETEAISGLFNRTPVFDLAESLLGRGKLNPRKSGQIALRFPGYSNDPAPKLWPHIDGVYSEHNGVPKGRILNFTMLACVLLSDLNEQYAGNFAVWPGTHRRIAAYLKEHGPESLLECKGLPPIELPAPVQITGQAGDLVLAHYLLAHTAAPNLSAHVRYAIFYRLTPNDRAADPETGPSCRDAIIDPWMEWPGLKPL